MPWDQNRYEECLLDVDSNILLGKKPAVDYMGIYKQCIEDEDYEKAKAIADILINYGYRVEDTHRHIKSLNKNK